MSFEIFSAQTIRENVKAGPKSAYVIYEFPPSDSRTIDDRS